MEIATLGDVAQAAAVGLGAAAALLGVGASVRAFHRRTLGRRRDRYARLARLGTGAQLSFFTAVLGEPPAIKRTLKAELDDWSGEGDEPTRIERDFTEWFFVDRDYYVQTLTDEDETVQAFSITTRSKRFAPTFAAIPPPASFVADVGRKSTGFPILPRSTRFALATRALLMSTASRTAGDQRCSR